MNTSKQLTEAILLELWQSAIFDDTCYSLLEECIKTHAQNKPMDEKFLDTIHHALATVRNRDLITQEGQEILRKTVVGFFGMSVGSHAVLTWMTEARADIVKIMDPDIISPSNLNRLRWGWHSIGKKKIDAVKDALLEVNPAAEIIAIKSKKKEAMLHMLEDQPGVSIIVDEIDDIEGKILLRNFAKEHHIPLLSAADVGDNVILDIERYDKEPDTQPFLGRIPAAALEKFSQLSDLERRNYIIKLVGFEQNSEEMLDALLAIGKTLSTWPQLGATATITGGVIATTIKKIMLDEKVVSGRYYLSLDELLVKDYNADSRKQTRKEKIDKVKEKFAISD